MQGEATLNTEEGKKVGSHGGMLRKKGGGNEMEGTMNREGGKRHAMDFQAKAVFSGGCRTAAAAAAGSGTRRRRRRAAEVMRVR